MAGSVWSVPLSTCTAVQAWVEWTWWKRQSVVMFRNGTKSRTKKTPWFLQFSIPPQKKMPHRVYTLLPWSPHFNFHRRSASICQLPTDAHSHLRGQKDQLDHFVNCPGSTAGAQWALVRRGCRGFPLGTSDSFALRVFRGFSDSGPNPFQIRPDPNDPKPILGFTSHC